MQFSLHIDMVAIQRWEISIQQAAVFSYIYTCPAWCEKDPNDSDYFNISNGKLATELPSVSSKRDTMLRHILGLVRAGVIERKSINKKQYIKLTNKGKSWNKIQDKNPATAEATGNSSQRNGKSIPEGTGNSSVVSVNQSQSVLPVSKTDRRNIPKPLKEKFNPPSSIPLDRWGHYLESRREKKHPMNAGALALCAQAIEKTISSGVPVHKIMDKMIEAGWRSCEPKWFGVSPQRNANEPTGNEALAAKVSAEMRAKMAGALQ